MNSADVSVWVLRICTVYNSRKMKWDDAFLLMLLVVVSVFATKRH